ncbi:MAG: DUF423 domain-containing protein [Ekhidna sp.]|uniref:DUF423 domain-containing protein n=1 Tax=Ekhidna sp. TaxID=2608089 RepID=UPI0032EC4D1F
MHKLFLIISSISGILAVSLGAFGAHALKDKLTKAGTLETYQTAVQYHFYHTLALLAIALLLTKVQSQWLNYAGYSMTFGILIFSGSLYVLCFTGMKWLGAITPIGGLLFIAGWVCLLMTALKSL